MKLTVVIPCFNERHAIREIIAAVQAAPVADMEVGYIRIQNLRLTAGKLRK